MAILDIIFWISFFAVFYAYLGYPACLWLLALVKSEPVKKQNIRPCVSLVISAYNEERILARKIENILDLDYPEDLLEVAIISDGSTDRTNNIIREYAERNKKILPCIMPMNKGKTACLNHFVPKLRGEIVLFSDANAFYDRDLVFKIVRAFADEKVGFVTGSTRYFSTFESEGIEATSLYARLETFVKKLETKIGSCVGADGAVFAIRKHLYIPPPPHGMNDFEVPLTIIKGGHRGILDPQVYCREEAASTMKGELRRHIRISSRTIRAIFDHKDMLNPFRYRVFSFQLLSHKVLKLFVPLFMLLILFSGIMLAVQDSCFYQVILLLQVMFYLGAVMSPVVPAKSRIGGLLAICHSFVYINAAIFWGWISFLSGETYGTWVPVRK